MRDFIASRVVGGQQQIKTSISGYNFFSGSAQLSAVMGKRLKLHNFWIHTFIHKLELCDDLQFA